MEGLTVLLDRAARGDEAAVNELFSVMYPDLRRLAHSRLRRSEPVTLLDTTSLVHESYLRFLRARQLRMSDRVQFLAYSSRVMRSVIVDLIRRRHAERRGGDATRVSLEADLGESVSVPASEEQIVQVNDALNDLAKINPRLVHVVEMRYFAGMKEQEIAESLGVTERTVRRDWEKARLMLRAALE